MRRWALRALLALVTYAALEAMALLGLNLLRVTRGVIYEPLAATSVSADHRRELRRLLDGQLAYGAYSPTLGWAIKPNGGTPPYRANADGFRADREYPFAPPPHRVRVAAFGDSFTHADNVTNEETWEAVIERQGLAGRAVDVLNFGVFGYGLDQAFLRWRELGRKYTPQIVLIGYLSENIGRHVNVYRPFYRPSTGIPLAKPRFARRGDSLVLIPNPASRIEDYRALLENPAPVLARFGEYDDYFRQTPHASRFDYSRIVRLAKVIRHEVVDAKTAAIRDGVYNENSEAYQVTRLLLERFVADVRAAGATPLIVIFPTREDFRRRGDGKPVSYAPLRAYLDQRRYDHVEVLDAFPNCMKTCQLDSIIVGHFSAAGNRTVGEYLAGQLAIRLSDGGASGGDRKSH